MSLVISFRVSTLNSCYSYGDYGSSSMLSSCCYYYYDDDDYYDDYNYQLNPKPLVPPQLLSLFRDPRALAAPPASCRRPAQSVSFKGGMSTKGL